MPLHSLPAVAASCPEWQGSRTGRFLALLLLFAIVASWRLAEVRPLALVQAEALHNLFAFASGMFPPAHSAAFLKSVARPAMETMQIALLGTLLAHTHEAKQSNHFHGQAR